MGDFADVVRRYMDERGTSVRATARAAGYSDHTLLSKVLNGHKAPTHYLAGRLDDALGAGGEIKAAMPRQPAAKPQPTAASGAVEIEAIELARRALASDVGDGTCERIELAVDDLAIAYPGTPPAELLPRVRAHLGYADGLLGGRATLGQRRRLLVSCGWLSLLAATVLADLHENVPATAYARTAAELAAEAGHAEIAAWSLETRAWIALTSGGYRQAVTLSQAAQQAAPRGTSAYIQSTAQEGRAWARLGDAARTRDALARVEALASPLPVPDQPEHHYKYDPAKAEAYVVTTLAWAGDPAAEEYARHVLARFEAPAAPRFRRATAARLDLALTLGRQGKLDEAAGAALQAVTSGYLVPSNYWRAREVIAVVGSSDVPEGRELADAYRAELASRALEP
jgi:tetratricopeptide (TPR) repeat protein